MLNVLTINKDQLKLLKKDLPLVKHFSTKKDDITSCIIMENSNNKLGIKTTDRELELKINLDYIPIKEDFRVIINFKKLLEVLECLDRREDVILRVTDDELIFIQDDDKMFISLFKDSYEFYISRNIGKKENLNMEFAFFNKNLQKIYSTIDKLNNRYEFNGGFLNITKENKELNKDEEISFVSTDTRRLAINEVKIPYLIGKDVKLIIPKKAIDKLKRIPFNDNTKIYYDDKELIIFDDKYTFFTKLIIGEYTDYKRVIPKNTKYIITLPKKETLDKIKTVTKGAKNKEIQFEFVNEYINIYSLNSDIKLNTNIKFDYNLGIDFTLALNGKYMLDFINAMDKNKDTFTIEMNRSNIPFILRSEDFMTIVMPIVT